MEEGGNAALGLGISKRLIQDKDFEDYQPCSRLSDEWSREESD